MARRKRKSNNPDGRPSQGLSETRVLVPMPEQLADDATKRAAVEGVSRAEWIRAAMRDRLDIRRQTETAINVADDARAAEAEALRR